MTLAVGLIKNSFEKNLEKMFQAQIFGYMYSNGSKTWATVFEDKVIAQVVLIVVVTVTVIVMAIAMAIEIQGVKKLKEKMKSTSSLRGRLMSGKKGIAILLTLVMLMTMVPTFAFAGSELGNNANGGGYLLV
ncbi:MAG: hypothetical protein LBN34_08685 [Clostridiales Family XIII bacterium]|nr:hypothetical protein [Clostridiales Family XIII bacterium]